MKFNLDVNHIKYIKIICSDKEQINHCIKASIKTLDNRIIYACAKTDNLFSIVTPQKISLNIVCDNGLYSSEATLKFIETNDEYVFFTINMPEDFEYKQNREYFRVCMDADVLLRFSNKTFSYKLYDISANGIRIILDEDIEIPENVELDILFSPKDVKTDARFIRKDNEDGILKASFFFTNMSEQSRDLISQKCIRKQLEDRRNSVE